MRSTGRLPALLCVFCALVPTTAAAAKPRKLVIPPGFSIEATLPKSGGFALSVATIGHRQILVLARRKGQSTSYTARGRADRHGISADFGHFGRMQMRFDGATGTVANAKGCKGRPTEQGIGTFEGFIRFHGRGGFASVAAERIHGRYQRNFRQVCNRSGSEIAIVKLGAHGRRGAYGPTKISGDVLEADSHVSGRITSFTAIRLDRFEMQPFITASVTEKIDGVRVSSLTQPLREPGSILFGEPGANPETASVRPAAPFSGEASYAKPTDGPVRWSGDLRAPLAGYGSLPLTGPDFRAATCHFNGNSFSGCDEAQGSGSHSQPLALARLSSLR